MFSKYSQALHKGLKSKCLSVGLPAVRQLSVVPGMPKPPSEEEIAAQVKRDLDHKALPLKQRVRKNVREYVLNHQPQLRLGSVTAVLGGAWYAAQQPLLMLPSFLDGLGCDADTVLMSSYGVGMMSGMLGLYCVRVGSEILSLVGQPSEAVIRDLMRTVFESEELKSVVGDDMRLGKYASVAVKEGQLLPHKSKASIYQQWLKFDKGLFCTPFHIQSDSGKGFWKKVLGKFPGFQTAVWNANYQAAMKNELKDTDLKDIPPASNNGRGEEGETRDRTLKIDTDYTGWEKFLRPRRLQLLLHVNGSKDNGIVLAEVEKCMTGTGHKESGGFMRYRTLSYVSLTSGQVTVLRGPEVPTLLGQSHLSLLFDTVPVEHRLVGRETISYILAEDAYKTQLKLDKAKEKEQQKQE